MTHKNAAIKQIKDTFELLSKTQDLSPNNPDVNNCLSSFVTSICRWHDTKLGPDILNSGEIANELDALPKLCGQAECEMEKFWAQKLLNNSDLKNDGLKDFWYFDNYQKLYDSENALAHLDRFNEISILGSGSMPLTAYFIVKNNPHVKVKCVDYDCKACELAGKLMKAIGIEQNIEIIQANALDYKPSQGELVICASLLDDKQALYKSLLKNNVTSLLVRDAEDIYQLLYKPAEKPPEEFYTIGKTMPNAEIINTSILYAANGNLEHV